MSQYAMYKLLLLVAVTAAVLTFFVVLASRKHRDPFYLQSLLICAAFIFMFDYFEISSRDDSSILLMSHICYVFIAFFPVFWFLFAYQLASGWRKNLRRLCAELSILPILTSLIVFSDSRYHLLWKSSAIVDVGGYRGIAVQEYGPWFWIHCAYSYFLILVGAVLVLREYIGHFDLYKKQAVLVVAAIGTPLLCNFAYLLRLFPWMTRDLSPISMTLSSFFFIISIRKYKLLELRPPPRGRMGEYLDEGIVIVDLQGRIVDCNDSGLRMLKEAGAGGVIGRSVDEVLPSCTAGLVELAASSGEVYALSAPNLGAAALWLSAKDVSEPRTRRLDCRNRWRCITLSHARRTPSPSSHSVLSSLSNRELEIADYLTAGMSLKHIAARLFVSENTVKTHVRHIYRKAGISNRRELAELVRTDDSRP